MEGMEEQVGCGTRFSSEFSGQLYMFCLFVCLFFLLRFLCLLDWIALILVSNERSLPPAQVRWQSCPWPLKLMTSQVVQSTLRAFQGLNKLVQKLWRDHLPPLSSRQRGLRLRRLLHAQLSQHGLHKMKVSGATKMAVKLIFLSKILLS